MQTNDSPVYFHLTGSERMISYKRKKVIR